MDEVAVYEALNSLNSLHPQNIPILYYMCRGFSGSFLKYSIYNTFQNQMLGRIKCQDHEFYSEP